MWYIFINIRNISFVNQKLYIVFNNRISFNLLIFNRDIIKRYFIRIMKQNINCNEH